MYKGMDEEEKEGEREGEGEEREGVKERKKAGDIGGHCVRSKPTL